ncbi:MAG: hypothetical protein ACYCYO_02200 [Bacilli bacterium]
MEESDIVTSLTRHVQDVVRVSVQPLELKVSALATELAELKATHGGQEPFDPEAPFSLADVLEKHIRLLEAEIRYAVSHSSAVEVTNLSNQLVEAVQVYSDL